jgi:hypothetical protein
MSFGETICKRGGENEEKGQKVKGKLKLEG